MLFSKTLNQKTSSCLNIIIILWISTLKIHDNPLQVEMFQAGSGGTTYK